MILARVPLFARAKAAMARSVSEASRKLIGLTSIPSDTHVDVADRKASNPHRPGPNTRISN
jgi:hypothetical protein